MNDGAFHGGDLLANREGGILLLLSILRDKVLAVVKEMVRIYYR